MSNDMDKFTRNSKKSKHVRKHLLLASTLLGIIVAVVAGTTLRQFQLSDDTIMLISYPGELFLRILRLLTMPLLTSSLINVTANLNARMSGKIALRTMTYITITTIISALMGMCIALVFQPGDLNLPKNVSVVEVKQNSKLLDSILDLGRNIFPDNLFQATFQQTVTKYARVDDNISIDMNNSLVEPKMMREVTTRSGVNTIGLVVFCMAFGIVLNTIGDKGAVLKQFFSALFEVMLKMVSLVIWLSGFGVASIITAKLLSIDNLHEVISQLAVYSCCVLLGIVLHQLVLLPAIYFAFLRKNPYTFLIKLVDTWSTAFATTSAVTLPTALHCMNDKMKCDPRISNFVLTIGNNLNTNGTNLFMVIACIFIARLSGATLEFGDLIIIVLISTIVSMSMPSMPSASLVMLFVILSAVDVGAQNVSLLFAVDWLLDRFRTTSNVIGDCFATAVIGKISKNDLIEMDILEKKADENKQLLQIV